MTAVYTVREVADLLRCSPQTVYRSIDAGQLPAVRLMGVVRVPVAAIDLALAHSSASATTASSSLCSATDGDGAAIGDAGTRVDGSACGEVGAASIAPASPTSL